MLQKFKVEGVSSEILQKKFSRSNYTFKYESTIFGLQGILSAIISIQYVFWYMVFQFKGGMWFGMWVAYIWHYKYDKTISFLNRNFSSDFFNSEMCSIGKTSGSKFAIQLFQYHLYVQTRGHKKWLFTGIFVWNVPC